MKKSILTFKFLILNFLIFAQGVSINISETAPDSSAILDISSSEKGLLLPRMATAERDAISGAAQSLLIYNTTTKCFEFWAMGNWHELGCATIPFSCGDSVADLDGNKYNTVQIGTQCWFDENLKTTKFNDGSDIKLVTNNMEWLNLTTSAYCWYDNNYATYGSIHGGLYNFYAVDTADVEGKNLLCPQGWHVQTEPEWESLISFIGGASGAAPKLKSTSGWPSGQNGTDDYEFKGLPSGHRRDMFGSVIFYEVNATAYWTTSTINGSNHYYYWMSIGTNPNDINQSSLPKNNGFPVRCMKNN